MSPKPLEELTERLERAAGRLRDGELEPEAAGEELLPGGAQESLL